MIIRGEVKDTVLANKVLGFFKFIPNTFLVAASDFKCIRHKLKGVPGMPAKGGYGLIIFGLVVFNVLHCNIFLC